MRTLIDRSKRIAKRLFRSSPSGQGCWFANDVEPEFRGMFGNLALQVLIRNFQFETVLDVGSGAGRQAAIFERHGKKVTSLDLGVSVYFAEAVDPRRVITQNYLNHGFDEPFECVWASHVLEHQPNAHDFLKKIHQDLKEGGVVAITVPPLKHQVVGGHVSLWNAGLLLYHLVLAGFDCRDAHVCSYAYNISVIVKKRTIRVPQLHFDSGDINRIQDFLPIGCAEGFDGNIARLNWPWLSPS